MDRRSRESLGGERETLSGTDLLVLGGQDALYVIEEGSLAVLSCQLDSGIPTGPRRPLFRLGSGAAMISVAHSPEAAYGLVAASLGDTVLRKVTLEDALRSAGTDGALAAELVDGWINHLAELFSGVGVPGPEAVRNRTPEILWAEVAGHGGVLMGADALVLDSDTNHFPLGTGMWITSGRETPPPALGTSRVPDPLALASGLRELHRLLLAHLAQGFVDEERQERERLRSKIVEQQRTTDEAIGELATVLDPTDDPVRRETPLLTAVSAVGQALGIQIKPSGGSTETSLNEDPMVAIARSNRIRMRRVHLVGDWWKRDAGPLLAYSAEDDGRPLALLQRRSLKYEIFDPVTRERKPVTRASAELLRTEAVMIYRPLPSGPLGLKDLFKFSLKGRIRDLSIIIATGLVATLLGMITPQATAVLMDQVIPDANHSLLMQVGLALLAASFGQAVFGLSQSILGSRIGVGAEFSTQAALWDRLLSLRPAFFRQYSSGDLQKRVMAANAIGRELNGATMRSILSSFLAILNLALLFYYSSSLAWIAVAVALVALIVTATCGALIRRHIRALQEVSGRLYGLVIQLVGGVTKLKVAGAEQRAFTHWIRRYTRELDLVSKSQRVQDYVSVFNVVLPTLSLVCLYWFGFGQILGGRGDGSSGPSIGIFLAFYTAFGTFLRGATDLSSTVIGLLDTITRGKHVQPILEAEPETDVEKTDPGRLTGGIVLDRVVFRYDERGPKILDELSLQAEPGEFVALVGPSGSGKSTIFRLLLGFEVPESGSVLYDGHTLSGLDVGAVRRQLGVVLQSGRVSTGSIFENIASGRVITLDEAWDAARDAGLAADIEEMPMGMHTVVSEAGGNISGGQRQRLLIARALVTKPRILLFDEATSALDNKTQNIVSESLTRRNVTRIVIAHRLSTIRSADRIHFLDRGRILEDGRFEDLSERDGPFSRMMARQRI